MLLHMLHPTPAHHQSPTYLSHQDNGKPIFFSRVADVPLSFDHLRYYAG
jgi:hypothetical protein